MLSRADYLATLPRRRVAAGALIRDRQGRICLVDPTYKELMHLPGGTVEADESPSIACARELAEELGLEVVIGRLLSVDWVAPDPPVDPHGALMMVYDGGVLEQAEIDRIVVPADELRGVRFVHAVDLEQLVSPANHRRISAALESVVTDTVSEGDRVD